MNPQTLDDLLRAIGVPDGGPDVPLELESLQVITLVDLIEDALEGQVVLGSADVTRAHFATRRTLLSMLEDR
ncbi:MAG: hypothetical protein EA397_02440 [Deltaproteobacteria bacterium]|nr:MAG: hypothetical protein EA397_02440 [Deltaproteobacteria bacterium]